MRAFLKCTSQILLGIVTLLYCRLAKASYALSWIPHYRPQSIKGPVRVIVSFSTEWLISVVKLIGQKVKPGRINHLYGCCPAFVIYWLANIFRYRLHCMLFSKLSRQPQPKSKLRAASYEQLKRILVSSSEVNCLNQAKICTFWRWHVRQMTVGFSQGAVRCPLLWGLISSIRMTSCARLKQIPHASWQSLAFENLRKSHVVTEMCARMHPPSSK